MASSPRYRRNISLANWRSTALSLCSQAEHSHGFLMPSCTRWFGFVDNRMNGVGDVSLRHLKTNAGITWLC
jgi:hypothetical protein